MAGAPSLSHRVPWATIAALLIAALSVLATLRAIVFPLCTIGDEFSKVSAIQGAGNFLPPDYPTTDLVVTANFAYDRYDSYPVRSLGLRRARYYEKLAKLLHLDVTNGQPALGYFNPTLRVVAVDGKVDTLRTLAEQISAAAPSLSVRVVQSEPSK